MQEEKKHFYPRMSIILIVAMLVSLVAPMAHHAEAKENDISVTAEYISVVDDEVSISFDSVSELNLKPSMSLGVSYSEARKQTQLEKAIKGVGGIIQKITAGTTSMSFGASGGTQSTQIYGNKGTLRADRNQDANGWVTATVNGSSVAINVSANTGGARTGHVDVTDMGSGQSVKLTIKQSAKVNTPTPTKKPTNTPTKKPTNTPTKKPTPTPTRKPTPTPTRKPTNTPTPRPTNTPTPKMSVSATALSFTAASATKSVTVTNSRGTLRADTNMDANGWVTATVSGTTVSIKVTTNTGTGRTGHVDITDTGSGQSIKITVSQSAVPTPTPTPKLSVSSTTLRFGYTSGAKSITVTNSRGTLRADTNMDANGWVTATVSGTTVSIKVTTNTGAERTGHVDITDTGSGQSVKITVIQSVPPTPTPTPKMTVDNTSLSFTSASGSKSITVANNRGALRADTNMDANGWVTATVSGTTVSIKVTTNTGAGRTGHVDITDTGSGQSVKITVSQSAAPTPTPTPKLSVSSTTLSFDNSSGTKSISVAYNKGTLRADTNMDANGWVTATVSGTMISIKVTTNIGAERTGHVDITDTGSGQSVKITVSQSAAPTPTPTPSMSVSLRTLRFGYTSGAKSITVTNSRGTLRADTNMDANGWVTATVSGTTISIKVTANTGAERTGHVDITDTGSGQSVKITVIQSVPPTPTPTPKMTVDNTSLSFTSASGSKSITVANNRGALRADTNMDANGWVTATVSGNTVSIKVTANAGGGRTGHVDITDTGSGQSIKITVTQSIQPSPTPIPKLAADLNSLSFTSEKSGKKINLVNVLPTSKIRVDLNMDAMGWVAVSEGTTTFTVNVTANTTGEFRKGHVSFTDTSNGRSFTLTVNQSNIVYCNISFDVNGGYGEQYISAMSAEQGKAVGQLPSAPGAPQYKAFDGWYDQKAGGKKYTESSIAPRQEELKLYAHWIYKDYTIVYDGNQADNGMMQNTPAKYGEWVLLSKNQYIKNGYVFVGWKEKVTGNIYKDGQSVKDIGGGYGKNGATVTLVAQWEKPTNVTVTFDVNGGNASSLSTKTKTVVYCQTYGELPNNLTHPNGLIFDGWENEKHIKIVPSMKVDTKENHTLYAVWRPNEFTIHFDGNGAISGSMEDIHCKYGESVKLPKCTFDDGIQFDCWGTKKDGSGVNFKANTYYDAWDIIDYTKSEITLYAIWKEYLYVVEYHDGFTGELLHKDYKSDVPHKYYPMEAPQVDGLKFYGWSRQAFPGGYPLEGNFTEEDGLLRKADMVFKAGQPTIVTENLRVYAVYSVIEKDKQVPVVYNLNGGTGGPDSFYVDRPSGTNGVPYEIPRGKEPTKTGFVFCGWTTSSFAETAAAEESFTVYNFSEVIFLNAIWRVQWAYVELDYGYEKQTDGQYVTSDNPFYTFEDPYRFDFICTGWKTADGIIHPVGSKVEVPMTGLKATAQWKAKEYRFVYKDSHGNIIKTIYQKSGEHLLTEDNVAKLAGKHFDGWMFLVSGGQTISNPDTKVSDVINMAGEKDKYELTAHYVNDKRTQNGFLVCYDLNSPFASGGPTEGTYGDPGTGKAVLSTAVPTRPGCKFAGWGMYGQADYQPGETADLSNRMYGDTVTLYACWKSKYTFTLDSSGVISSNGITSFQVSNALPNEKVNMLKYKNAFGSPDGYTLVGWGTKSGVRQYSVEDEVPVPESNITLYAIWVADTYTVVTYDYFSGQEIGRQDVFGKQFILAPSAPDVAGYEFKGWALADPYDKTVKYTKYSSIYVNKNMELHAVYEPVVKEDNQNFTIVYLPNGGTGGPGIVKYTPGEVLLSTVEPTREGYTFRGWSFRNQNDIYYLWLDEGEYPPGKENKFTGVAGERYELYAVWVSNSANEMKFVMEELYGAQAIKDEFFDKPYYSSDWEYINSTTYYIVRTKDKNNSKLCRNLTSTVMVMEYRDGCWTLKAKGTKEGAWERVRLNVLTSKTNTAAEVLDTTFEVVNAIGKIGVDCVSVYCPAVGVVVKGMHYLNKAADCIRTMDDYEFFEDWLFETAADLAIDTAVSKVKGEIDGKLLGEVLSAIHDTTGLDKKTAGYIVDVFKAAEKSLREELPGGDGGMDPFGDYDKAIAMFQNRVKDQFNASLANKVPDVVNKIYSNVTYR